MADSNTHINYSVADIERYLQGKMNAKEMHDMERAALQDPLLADAIEGYSNASFDESHKHLNEITAALLQQKEESKVVPMPSHSFYWWKIAAMIILVAGVGVLSWFIINSNNSTENAQDFAHAKENKAVNADSAKELKEQSASTFGNTDTVNSSNKPDTESSTLAQNKSEKPAAIKKEYKNLEQAKSIQLKPDNKLESEEAMTKQKEFDSFSIANQNAVANPSVSPKSEMLNKAPSNIIVNDSVKLAGRVAGLNVSPSRDKRYFYSNNNALINNFLGRVTDTNNQPVPYATISVNNNQAITTTDAKGNFKLQAPDSLLKVTVSSVGFMPETTQLKSTVANFISIQQDKNVLNDVVITGYGAKNKNVKTDTANAYPLGGWESFQAYVYKKLKKPVDTTSAAQIMGDVQLEFSIDSNGDPYNFSVLKSSNNESASKAIEIIKEGPKWITAGKNKKGKVTIQF